MSKNGPLCVLLVFATLMLFGISRNCLADGVTYTVANLSPSSIGISDTGNLTLKIGNLAFSNDTLSYAIDSSAQGSFLSLPDGTATLTIPNLGSNFKLYPALDGNILNSGNGNISYTPSDGFVTVTWNGKLDFTIAAASPAPIPTSGILLGSGLLGLIGFGVRRQRNI